jgi:hypothetical protein
MRESDFEIAHLGWTNQGFLRTVDSPRHHVFENIDELA